MYYLHTFLKEVRGLTSSSTLSMRPTTRAYLEMHFAVLLYGFTAILGNLIQLPATVLVWWRVLITSISLFFLIRLGKDLIGIPRKLIFQYMGIGILVALHWISFFGSVKYANASVAMICFATTAFFTSLLEPLLSEKQSQKQELLLGILVVLGIILVVQGIPPTMFFGVFLGLISALLIAFFAIFNKRLIDKAPPTSITFLEMLSSWLFISCCLPFFFYYAPESAFLPNYKDWVYLLILALMCTTLAYVLNLRALKHLSAFTTNLIANLEVVYGILLAILLLQENKILSIGFYMGVLLILAAVFGHPFLNKQRNEPE